MEAEIKELEEKMKQTLKNLFESAELSAKIIEKHPEHKKRIDKYWTDFIKHFISRVKEIDKAHGGEVFSGFSLSSLLKLVK